MTIAIIFLFMNIFKANSCLKVHYVHLNIFLKLTSPISRYASWFVAFYPCYFQPRKWDELQCSVVFLTWLIIKMFGIFLLNFLWLRNTTMTVKLDTIPTEAMVLWAIRILWAFRFPLLELSGILSTNKINVSFTTNLVEWVTSPIGKQN